MYKLKTPMIPSPDNDNPHDLSYTVKIASRPLALSPNHKLYILSHRNHTVNKSYIRKTVPFNKANGNNKALILCQIYLPRSIVPHSFGNPGNALPTNQNQSSGVLLWI